ncbi:hypothetical protein [Hydrogenophaga sp.]|uniref:COG4648 family protein n=1 Tax=Hydrogenophaga sp. TaxID=1904254 RepID=UPI0035B0F766
MRLPNTFDADRPAAGHGWKAVAVVLVAVAWAWAAHVASSQREPAAWGVLLAILPASTAVVVALWRTTRRWIAVALAVGLAIALATLWPWLLTQVALLFLIEQLGVYALLAALFGRSLRGPGESLVTQLARRVHGGVLSAAQERYTRKVTVAWTLYFIGIGLSSVLLFVFAPPAVWSLFANVLAGPLIGLMFVAEFLCRRVALAGEDNAGFADAIRAWKAHNAQKAP